MKRVTFVLLLVSISTFAASAELSGTLVVLNKAEATASLVNLADGQVRATLPTAEGPHEAAVSPDGRLALVGNYGRREAPGSSLTVIDIAEAEVVRTIDLGEYRRPHGMLWLDDGRRALVTAETNKALLEVDVIEGKVVRAFETDQDVSHMVSVALGGQRAFVANIGSGSVSIIDLERGSRLENLPTGDGAEGITASIDGTEVWVTNRGADTVTIVNARSLEITSTISCASFPIRVKATPDGKYMLVSCARSGDIAVIDTTTHEIVRRIEQNLKAADTDGRLFGDQFNESSVPIGIVIHPDGKKAWVAHTNADVVAEMDLEAWEVTRLLTAGREPDGMAYSHVVVAKD
jgi:YVTN family beta-propeller protein